MATLGHLEGHSTTKPLFFDGNDYAYWKVRIIIFLQATDFEFWEIVSKGPNIPMKINDKRDNVPKSSSECDEIYKRYISMNTKAINVLYCAVDNGEFNRISGCESGYEIWHTLEVVYKGTSQVKESKISRLTRQYELFKMESHESIHNMYTRFTDIVNSLKTLGKTFTNIEQVKKILKSLPKE